MPLAVAPAGPRGVCLMLAYCTFVTITTQTSQLRKPPPQTNLHVLNPAPLDEGDEHLRACNANLEPQAFLQGLREPCHRPKLDSAPANQ